jgi:hypothetical protein
MRTRSPRFARLAATITLATVAATVISACDSPSTETASTAPDTIEMLAAAAAAGMVRNTFPDPDPGIPAYARLGSLSNQIFHTDEWVVIPFYRNPDAIPPQFNLLGIFDFPSQNGPGAFAAPLLVTGYYMIEAGAPLGTFPKISISKGAAVPIWFVPWSVFESAIADNVLTMAELRALDHVEGVASQFTETLRPRIGEHLLVLNASGALSDGRRFDVHITHLEDKTASLRIDIR